MGDGRTRRPKGKKRATVGSGGNNRRRLEGKGPTPKAEERVYHKAYKEKQVRDARKAQAEARERSSFKLRRDLHTAPGHELICGRNPVREAVRAGVPLTRVFMQTSAVGDERLAELVAQATALGAPLVEVSHGELDRMTDNAVHQGVAIEVPPYEYADAIEEAHAALERHEAGGPLPLFVALDSVTDPHNLGEVLRSAAAFNADAVIVPERRAAGVNATVWKVSAGAVSIVPTARVTNLASTLDELKKMGYFVVGLDGGGSTTVENLSLADTPLVLVTGSEGRGLARLIRDKCDVIASIPIAARMESLNAAVATGISLYQVDRIRARMNGGDNVSVEAGSR